MDFKFTKPAHIFALFLLVISFLLAIISPIYQFFTPLETTSTIDEITLVFFSLILAIVIFIIIPLIWYFLVNKLNFKAVLSRIKLRKDGMDMAVLWGIISMIAMFVIMFVIGIILTFYGANLEESSNITDLEQIFSLPSIFFIVIFQPIGEEIFFRGFLLEKINSMVGRETAIVVTSVLFGIAHLTYGNIYPAIMTGILGLILAYMVVKTKNLTTAIVAHIFFNVTSVTLYIIGQSFMP